MSIDWVKTLDEVLHARWSLGDGEVIGLDIESLLPTGWDWHVWHNRSDVPFRSGTAENLDDAKAAAECALSTMLVELGIRPAYSVPSPT